jgi:hypothetical protein
MFIASRPAHFATAPSGAEYVSPLRELLKIKIASRAINIAPNGAFIETVVISLGTLAEGLIS